MTTYTYIHSFMTLSQRFDPNHDTCVTRLVWRRRVPWGLVVLAREYPCMYVCRKMRTTVRLGLDTNAVWVDARQMMTTRTSDTQTQTSSQDTQPAGCHTP